MAECSFRAFRDRDLNQCLLIFDANCPEYFAPDERKDYALFLESSPVDYEICEIDGQVVGAFGLIVNASSATNKVGRLNWIMLDSNAHRKGVGTTIMNRVVDRGLRLAINKVYIDASHKSAPFFSKFGAKELRYIENGWGPGMHRVEMLLVPDA